MLNALIRFSLRHRPLIVIGCLVVLLYGGYQTTQMPIDVFPDLDRPRVVVMTECPGLAPEEVETLVTFPLESALLGATGVQDVRSQSGFGLSVINVEFDWNTDIRAARQVVQERLATVTSEMPNGVKPQMAPISSIMGQIMIAGVRRLPGPKGGELVPLPETSYYAERVREKNKTLLFIWQPGERRKPTSWASIVVEEIEWSKPDADGEQKVRARIDGTSREIVFPSPLRRDMALRTLADWVIRPRLLKMSGVAQVISMGGGRKQYQVLVNPDLLIQHEVTLQQVEQSLKDNNVNFSGGFSTQGGIEKPIRVIGRLGPNVIKDLEDIPVKVTKDRTYTLSQVATVKEGPQLKRGDASINGFPGVALTITKQPHTDTRALTEAVNTALHELESSLPADVIVETEIYEMRQFIDRGVYNVGEALVIGAVLVLIVLFLFLLNFRTTFISLTAIPLSLVVTALVFKLIGKLTGTELSINIMTLGGIAVAMGELVDDAIVDVENIYRRLRENNLSSNPKPVLRVIYDASVEIRSAIVFGTIMVILVFLPLFALTGIEGRLFTPLGIAYIVSILASLVVSLMVTPVLSYYLLAKSKATHRESEGFLVRGLKWAAAYLIRFSMKRISIILLLTALLVLYSGWRLSRMGRNFLPPFDEGTVQVNVTLPPGTSLDESNQYSTIVDRKLREFQNPSDGSKPLVLTFLRRTGRAEMDEHAEPPNANEFFVTINPDSGMSRKDTLAKLEQEVKEQVPGADVEVEQPLAHLISHMISGTTAQIAIKIYGDDLDTLEKIANQIKTEIGGVPGVSSLVVEPIRKVDEIHIKLRPDRLKYYGVSRAYVGEFLQTALQGEVVSQVIEGQRRFDLLVRLKTPSRKKQGESVGMEPTDYANLGQLRIELPDRSQVTLDKLADITPSTGGDSGANQVKRDNVRRRIVVRCNARDRDLASVISDIKKIIADPDKVKLPEGYFVEYGGQFESEERASKLILVLAIVAVVGMFFVLTMLFPSWRISLQILIAIPTAFIGGVFALMITGQKPSVAAWVGFISLGGIAARNGILLVTHYIHLMKHEGEKFTESMILRGSLERLSPVLMTALTAGIGLVPLVIAGQEPGREILYPVATVILGGLFTSTFCEFLIRPGLFWRWSGQDAVRLAKTEHQADGLDEAPTQESLSSHGAAVDGKQDPGMSVHQ